MSSFGGLDIGYTGLSAHRRRMDVISENIVNANTPGYSRQRVELSSLNRAAGGVFSGTGGGFGGVEATQVTRLRDRVLSDHARQQAGVAAVRTKEAEILARVEEALGGIEPGGLHDQMNALWNAFDDLANSPDDMAIRQIVLERADSLAQGFSRTTGAVDQLRLREIDDMVATVDAVNVLSGEIAALDSQILGSLKSSTQPNSLLDERDIKVTELAKLIDLEVVEHDNGQVALSVDGQLLVSNGRATPLELRIAGDATLGLLGYDRVTLINPSGRELRVTNGELGASLDTVMNTIPGERLKLDDLIDKLVGEVNAIHSTGAGLDGSTGLDLFVVGANRGQFALSTDVLDQPEKVAAAEVGAGALDETVARRMAHLSEAPGGPSSLLADAIGTLASRVAGAIGGAQAAQTASDQAASMAQAAGGVSLDQELTDLITAQRSFEAAARVITTVDEMLETMITSMGRVGR